MTKVEPLANYPAAAGWRPQYFEKTNRAYGSIGIDRPLDKFRAGFKDRRLE